VFAQQCFREYMDTADDFYTSGLNLIERGRNKRAAFQPHQAAEHYLKCAILAVTAYWPKEHNIKYMARLGVGLEPVLRDIFPVKPRAGEAALGAARGGIREARYSLTWRISRGDRKARRPIWAACNLR
jgi:hypothetical protein